MCDRWLRLLLYPAVVLGFVFAPPAATQVHAACGTDSVFGIPTWHKYLDSETVGGKCTPIIRGDNPEDSVSPVLSIGIAVLEIAVTLGAMVAFVMVLWGSFNFLTSLGESDKAASARKTVQNAAIGLAILLISTRVVSFIGNTVT